MFFKESENNITYSIKPLLVCKIKTLFFLTVKDRVLQQNQKILIGNTEVAVTLSLHPTVPNRKVRFVYIKCCKMSINHCTRPVEKNPYQTCLTSLGYITNLYNDISSRWKVCHYIKSRKK